MTNLEVYLPCYNEQDNIGELVRSWMSHTDSLKDLGYDLSVFCIDDCSTDATKSVIEGLAQEYASVHLVSHEKNMGLVGGLNTAITLFAAKDEDPSYMVLMDGDNTHDPKYIFPMIAKMHEGFDCVIASRYCGESKVIGLARFRILLSDLARYYYKLILRIPGVEDYTCGYRIYSHASITRLVECFGPQPIKETSFACMMEFLYRIHQTGSKCGEVGFQLRYDKKLGSSKMSVLHTMIRSLIVAPRLKRK